jgi:tetratricopeptide (TPR) repeat protein
MKHLRLTFLTFLLVLLSGCTYGRLLMHGDELFQKGEYEKALAKYEAAAKLDPKGEEAALKVRTAREKVVEKSTAQARESLGKGDFLGALKGAAKAFKQQPEEGAVQALVREVSDATQAEAAALIGRQQFSQGLKLLEELGTRLPPEAPTAATRSTEARTAWTTNLLGRAAQAEKAGLEAEALLLLSKAAQLTPGAPGTERRGQLRSKLLERYGYSVQLAGTPSEPGFAYVASGLKERPFAGAVRLLGPGEKVARPSAVLRASFRAPGFDLRTNVRTESAQYQSGTRQVANPFYRMREDTLEAEERRLVEAENEVIRQQQYVEQYQAAVAREGSTPNTTTGAEQSLSNAQSRLVSARSRVMDQRNQVQRAREDLRRESPTKEEPVYSAIGFSVTTHVLSATTQVRGAIEHQDGREALTLDTPLAVEARDDEHAAQPIASVAADPLQLPSKEELTQALYADALKHMVASIEQSAASYQASLLQAAQAAPPEKKLNGLALYLLVSPGSAVMNVQEELRALSGIPDAVSVLAQ